MAYRIGSVSSLGTKNQGCAPRRHAKPLAVRPDVKAQHEARLRKVLASHYSDKSPDAIEAIVSDVVQRQGSAQKALNLLPAVPAPKVHKNEPPRKRSEPAHRRMKKNAPRY